MKRLRAWMSRRMLVVVAVGSTLSAGAVGGSLLGSAKRSDALHHLELVGAAGLAEAVTGQFYVITDTGEVKEPLCGLKPDEFEPSIDRYDLVLTNSLGDSLPLVLWIWDTLVPMTSLEAKESASKPGLELRAVEEWSVPTSRLSRHNRRILGEARDRDVIAKEGTDEDEMRRTLRYKDCADTVRYFVKETPFHICQLRRVVEVEGQLFGVNFATLCLTKMGGEPVQLPELNGPSIWTRTKKALGFIDGAKVNGS